MFPISEAGEKSSLQRWRDWKGKTANEILYLIEVAITEYEFVKKREDCLGICERLL
jgi:hypothetical protein